MSFTATIPPRMMDIVREVQCRFGHVSGEAMDLIAGAVGSHRVEVESVVSFYSSFPKSGRAPS